MTELSPEARALITTVGRSDGLDPERRAKLERRLAASAAAVATTLGATSLSAAMTGKAGLAAGAVTAAMPLAPSAATIGLWLSVGAAIGGVTVASISALTAPSAAETRPPVAVQALARPTCDGCPPVNSAPRAKLAEAQQPRVAEPVATRASTAPRRPSAAAAPELEVTPEAAPVSTAFPSDVSLEARSLEAARRELAAGHASAALNLLAQHEQKFPSGVLREERLALTTVALCSLGRREEARQIAEAFLRAAPRSPLVPRLRESCAFSGAAIGKPGAK